MKRAALVLIAALVLVMPFLTVANAANTSGSITVNAVNKADKSVMVGKPVSFIKVADGKLVNSTPEFTLT